MPLFIKVPGQVDGEIRDDSVQNLDVLPSIVDLLGRRGRLGVRRPLAVRRQRGPHRAEGLRPTSTPRSRSPSGAREDFPYGDDWMALAAVGDNGDLVGTTSPISRSATRATRRATLDQADLFDALPTDDGELPFVLAGTVTGGSSEPPELVAAVNGTIAGVVGGYRPQRRRLGVHRLRRRPLRRRSQRRGAVRGHPRRRRRHPAPGELTVQSSVPARAGPYARQESAAAAVEGAGAARERLG